MNDLSIVIFCGGRGATTLIQALTSSPHFSISLVINGYDNGLSTGSLRARIPGLLGPSDFRKTMTSCGIGTDQTAITLRDLYHKRLPPVDSERKVECLKEALRLRSDCFVNVPDEICSELYNDLTTIINRLSDASFPFQNCSIGNLFMAGRYLRCNHDFNRMIDETAILLRPGFGVHNVTSGENLFLVALTADGRLVSDEAEIVENADRATFIDIALVDKPLHPNDLGRLQDASLSFKKQHLREITRAPTLSRTVRTQVQQADLVILAPGTLHSSLLPSLLTTGLAECLSHLSVPIVHLVNIHQDHDIPRWDAASVTSACTKHLGPQSITHAIVDLECNHDEKLPSNGNWPKGVEILSANLEDSSFPGKHDGAKTLSVLSSILG